MRVLILGATGMIGQGVLRECLSAPDVDSVLVAGRTPLGQTHPKLTEVLRPDLLQWTDVEPQLAGIDACFYCLGVSSAGLSEPDYRRVTVDFAVALATSLERASPNATFCFISGASTDGAGTGKTMWARVKGQAENALRALGFKRLFLFRPAYIQPMDGIVSKTGSYRVMYAVMAPLYPLWKRLMPNQVTSTRQLGRAMLQVTRNGFAKEILESADINVAAQ
ncbi:MAG: epimerase [Myxococcales bacterium]|nr:epimerase [Myxococcales bacterium]